MLPQLPEKSHKNHIIVGLVYGSWDDDPVHHAVFMKCAYRNSLCPVKPQFWSVLVFKTTPNNSQQEELLWTSFGHNNHYSNNLSSTNQKWWLIILSHFKYQTDHHQPNLIITKGKLPPCLFLFSSLYPPKKKHILFVLVLFIWLSPTILLTVAFNTPPIKELIDAHWYEITFIILNLIELMFLKSHSPSCYIWMITVWVCHKPSLSTWHWW